MDAATRAPSRPYWLPEDTEFAALPRPLQVAITEILYPAYKQLVLGAADPLERATAATFVHLLWLELLQQLELGNCLEDLMRPNFGSAALNGVIAQHLRLVAQSASGQLSTRRAGPLNFPNRGGSFWKNAHLLTKSR